MEVPAITRSKKQIPNHLEYLMIVHVLTAKKLYFWNSVELMIKEKEMHLVPYMEDLANMIERGHSNGLQTIERFLMRVIHNE